MPKDVEIKIKWDDSELKVGSTRLQKDLGELTEKSELSSKSFESLNKTTTQFFGKSPTGLLKMNQGLTRATTSGKKLTEQLKRLREQNEKLNSKQTAATRIEKPIKYLNKELPKVTRQTGALSQGFEKLGATVTAFFGVQLISKTVTGLIEINKELLAVGVQAQGVVKAFNNIAGSDLDELREATKGTVSDLTLMQSAVKADKFQIPIEKMGSLLKFAGQAAKDTGENVDELASKISVAIGRKSLLILDDFGITASQIKKELGGMSAEAATVEQLADAVLRIAENSMGNYSSTLDTADAYNRLLAVVENMKLAGGEMLLDSEDLKDTIVSLTNTIITHAPAILQFVTEWGVGAFKIADAMADVAGFVADAFTTSTFEKYLEEVEKSNDLWDELIAKKRLLADLDGSALGNIEAEKKSAKIQVEAAEKKWQHQKAAASLVNDIIKKEDEKARKRGVDKADRLQKAKDELALELANKNAGAGAKTGGKPADITGISGSGRSLTSIELSSLESDRARKKAFDEERIRLLNEEFDKDETIREFKRNTISNYTNAEILNFEEQQQKQAEINQAKLKTIEYEWQQATDKSKKEQALRDYEKNKLEERNQMILSVATQSINAINSIIGIFANESLNGFGKAMGAVGAVSGLVNTFAPGVGSLIGAGASLLGGLFGQKEEEPTKAISALASIGSTSDGRPSATVTRESKNITNNIYVTNNVGNFMGDEQSQIDLSMLVAHNIADLQASIA